MNKDVGRAKEGRGRFFVKSFLPPLTALFFLIAGCRGGNNTSLPALPPGVVNISNNTSLSTAPSIAVSGNVVYVAWTDLDASRNMEVFLSRSEDGGTTFGAPVNVSQSAPFSGNPKMVASGNSLYIVWEEFIPTATVENNDIDIFFRRADDQNGTLTWDPPLNIPGRNLSSSPFVCGQQKTSPCPSQGPAIAVSGNDVFVAWGETTDYFYKVSTAAPLAKEIVVVDSEILMAQSFDNGVQFSPPIALSEGKSVLSASLNPTLATAGGRLYAAWEEGPGVNAKILYRRSPDPINGAFIPTLTQQATPLSGSIKYSNRPSLAADGDALFLLWEASPYYPDSNCPLLGADGAPLPNSEILLIRSSDQGVQFTNPDDLAESNFTNTSCTSNNGRIAVAAPFVFVVWEDNTPGLNGISLKRSSDGGVTFGAPENLSQTAGSAGDPAIAPSGGDLFVSWEDSTLGNLDIFFARR